MTSPTSVHHQRIDCAFSGRWADRIPLCSQGFASTVASRILGRDAVTGSTDVQYHEACAHLAGARAHEEFLDRLLADCVALHRAMDFDILYLPWRDTVRPTRRLDEHRILFGDPSGSDWFIKQFDPASHTFSLCDSCDADPSGDRVLDIMRQKIDESRKADRSVRIDPFIERAARQSGSEFVVAGSIGMAIPMQPGWLEATLLDPGLVGEYLDMTVENVLATLDALHAAGIRLINGGGDFAFNSGPIYSPQFFDQVMMPRWRKIFDFCREKHLHYVFRSDGNLWSVARSLFAGPSRPAAYYECDYDAGMRFGELRPAFPELVLMGNVSCDLLHRGTPDQVRLRITECLDAAAPRMVAASANAILHGTPVENVQALYDTAKAYRPKMVG